MIVNPHDRLVKGVFSDLVEAAALLEGVLPADVAACLDWSTLRQASGDLIDPLLDERHADLLFEVQRRAGGAAFVHVLVEHQSTPDRRMARRLLRYQGRIWDRFERLEPEATLLPPILSLVLYHGAAPWGLSLRFVDGLDLEGTPAGLRAKMVDFEYQVLDLAALPDDARVGRALGRLALLLLKYSREGDLWERLPRWVVLVKQAWASPTGLAALSLVLGYILEMSAGPVPAPVTRFLLSELGEPAMEVVSTWGERLRWEGRQEGRREGRQEGRQEAQVEMLLDAVHTRFGSVPEPVRQAILAADAEQITVLFRRILVATHVEALLLP